MIERGVLKESDAAYVVASYVLAAAAWWKCFPAMMAISIKW